MSESENLSITSKVFVFIYGVIIGFFLSKEFIIAKRTNNPISKQAFKYAKLSNKFRWVLFFIIGPYLLMVILFIIINVLV